MKRPKITHKDFNGFYSDVIEWKVNEYPLDGGGTYLDIDAVSVHGEEDTYSVIDGLKKEDAKAISAVPKMINALVGAYLLIDDMPIDERKERHLRVFNNMADALEKAGIQL